MKAPKVGRFSASRGRPGFRSFEVKYQDTETSPKKLKGLRLFLEEKKVAHGYVITQRWEDFGILETFSARKGSEREKLDARILSIPAPLACFWLSE